MRRRDMAHAGWDRFDCGCEMRAVVNLDSIEWKACPMHDAARDLLAVLSAIFCGENRYSIPYNLYIQAHAALAKATPPAPVELPGAEVPSLTRYQHYGVDHAGMTTHAGTHEAEANDFGTAVRVQQEWEEWRTIYLRQHPEASPLRDTAPTEYLLVHEIGKPETSQRFLIHDVSKVLA
jgi:hypothetical protein